MNKLTKPEIEVIGLDFIHVLFEDLTWLVQSDLNNVFFGLGTYATEISEICHKISRVIEYYVSHNDNDSASSLFLRNTLPALVEIFLRRKTLREHEVDVAEMLVKVARLLAQPASQEIMELCELRNYLVLSNYTQANFKFINTKMLKPPPNYGTSLHYYAGFYADYGRPNTAIIGSKTVSFWPDEWFRTLGGSKAVGHYVQIYSMEANCWYGGQVVEYERSNDKYIIQLDRDVVGASQDEPLSTSTFSSEQVHITVNLNDTKHYWVDLPNKHRFAGSSHKPNPSVTNRSAERLKCSLSDIGRFIRVWWSLYQCFYYGRIVDFDNGKIHSIRYEDSDMRSYDMSVKEYELINPPGYILSQTSNITDAKAAELVAIWHKKQEEVANASNPNREIGLEGQSDVTKSTHEEEDREGMTSPRNSQTSKSKEVQPVASNDISQYVQRPSPSQAFSLSLHLIAVITEFFKENGADSIYQSLVDINKPPPHFRTISLHLQFMYQVRVLIGYNRFREMVWDCKEGISFAISRYEDAQIKELNLKDFHDIFITLRDLLQIAVSEGILGNNTSANRTSTSSTVSTAGIQYSLEMLRLMVSSKLLTCSQLQRRFSGLSMLRDVIESVLPKIISYINKRYSAIGVSEKSNTISRLNGNQVNTASGAQPSLKSSLSSSAVDKWLLENKFVELLFGESLHQDLAAKSDIILAFMAHRRLLTESHLDTIWFSSKGLHEAVVRINHQLILVLVPILEPNLRQYLFTLISNTPFRDYNEQILQLVKSYTVQALIAIREESNSKSQSTNSQSNNNAAESANKDSNNTSSHSNGNGSSTADLTNKSSSATGNSLTRKGVVMTAPQRQWFGFSVLWQFVQDPAPANSNNTAASSSMHGESAPFPQSSISTNRNMSDTIDESLFEIAIQLLVELLELEFQDEREVVMERCLDNIQMGVSVPVSLQILRKTLGLYPVASKSWFSNIGRQAGAKVPSVGTQIDKLLKHYDLLEIVFNDLDKYHRSVLNDKVGASPVEMNDSKSISQSTTSIKMKNSKSLQDLSSIGSANNAKDMRSRLHTKNARNSYLKGVGERLEFIKFIISKSTVRLSESQTMLLWKALANDEASIETVERLCMWLDSLVNRENKSIMTLLLNLAYESDPEESTAPSKLSFLSPLSSALNSNSSTSGSANPTDDIELNTKAANSSTEPISSFEEGVLVKLFEEHVLKWAFKSDKCEILSRMPVASLCMKLFLLVNIQHRAIKVESDGSWTRTGLQPLIGLALIWRIAMDCNNNQLSTAGISILVELQHRFSGKSKQGDMMKQNFLKHCFTQLYFSMQTIKLGEVDNGNANSTIQVADLSQAAVTVETSSGVNNDANTPQNLLLAEWFEDGTALQNSEVVTTRISRIIITLRTFIHRFQYTPTQLVSIRILAGRDESLAFQFLLRSTDTVGLLRKKVAEHFKESPDAILLLRASQNAKNNASNLVLTATGQPIQPEKIEKDEMNLKAAKFNMQENIIARKKDPTAAPQNANQAKSDGKTENEPRDLIQPDDLSQDLLDVLQPFEWLHSHSIRLKQISSNGIQSVEKHHREKNHREILFLMQSPYDMFAIPPFPMRSHLEPKLKPQKETVENVSEHANTSDLSNIPMPTGNPNAEINSFVGDAAIDELFALDRGTEFLEMYMRMNPQFIDQLLNMLDGYLSTEDSRTLVPSLNNDSLGNVQFDLSIAVWDVLQALPTHSSLLKQLMDMVQDQNTNNLTLIFDSSSPYRLLYTLQIIDAIYTQDNAKKRNNQTSQQPSLAVAWAVNFFHIGGADHVLLLLNSMIERVMIGSSSGGNMNGTVSLQSVDKVDKDSNALFIGNQSPRNLIENNDAVQIHSNTSSGRAIYQTISGCNSMPRQDLNIMIVSILARILHHLLSLDPSYKKWQSVVTIDGRGKLFSGTPDTLPEYLNSKVPEGVIFSSIEAFQLVRKCLDFADFTTQLYEINSISSVALHAVVENITMLVTGITTALDNGLQALKECPKLPNWIRNVCLKVDSVLVRQSACRRIFEACSNIFNKCADPVVNQEQKRHRLELFDYLFYLVVLSAYPIELTKQSIKSASAVTSQPAFIKIIDPLLSRHGEQLYSLIAVMASLRDSPYLIFPEILSRKEIGAIRTPENRLERLDSSVFLLDALTKTGNPTIEFSQEIISSVHLSHLFVRKIMAHRSKESFHSSYPDGTLLGILRVLLMIANGSDYRRRLLGNIRINRYYYQRDPDDETIEIPQIINSSADLLSFLYIQGLFPDNARSTNTMSPIKGKVSQTVDGGSSLMENTIALCQTKESRKLCYALLYRLCEADMLNFSRLVTVMSGGEIVDEVQTGDTENDTGTVIPSEGSLQIYRKRSNSLTGNTKTSGKSRSSLSAPCNFMSLVSSIGASNLWDYDPNSLVKDPGAFVGLCNQGGTCYMNAFIQQLYNVPEFTSGLLKIAGSQSSNGVADEKPPDENEILLFQLQVMFGYLKLSQKRQYDTLPFCQSFIDYDGQPISLSEQKDINEFAGMLFEKLEHNPECANLLSSTIQGKVVWKTRSTESAYRSEREETFYMITAEVKGKDNLLDSLELNVAEELFSGDNKIEDSETGKKVDALRRCAIRKLPPTLIIHLKRFEFDIETMNRRKLNDYMSFPTELDMFPYTEEGLVSNDIGTQEDSTIPTDEQKSGTSGLKLDDAKVQEGKRDESESNSQSRPPTTQKKFVAPTIKPAAYYQYALQGIVAHVGAIDRGHYYSFIKERGDSNKWMEFNDRSVLPFNPESIPKECFGGVEEFPAANGNMTTRVRENNAYLLIYERKVKSSEKENVNDLKEVSMHDVMEAVNKSNKLEEPTTQRISFQEEGHDVDTIDPAENILAAVSLSRSISDHSAEENKFKSRQAIRRERTISYHEVIAPKVLDAIWTENVEFQKDRFLFDAIHFRFMWQLQKVRSIYDILDAIDSFYRNPNPSMTYQKRISISMTSDSIGDSRDLTSGESQLNDTTTSASIESPNNSVVMDSKVVMIDAASQQQRILDLSTVLAQMALLALNFNVEVLSRARAHSCVHLYFERLEDIVVQDVSLMCAETTIWELSRESSLEHAGTQSYLYNNRTHSHNSASSSVDSTKIIRNDAVASETNADSSTVRVARSPSISSIGTAGSSSARHHGPSTRTATFLTNREYLDRFTHPWLIAMLVMNPHNTTMMAFSKFIITCLKTLRSKHFNIYLQPRRENVAHKTRESTRMTSTNTLKATASTFSTQNNLMTSTSGDSNVNGMNQDVDKTGTASSNNIRFKGEKYDSAMTSSGNRGSKAIPTPVSSSTHPIVASSSSVRIADNSSPYLKSSVSRFINKILTVAEKAIAEDLLRMDGFLFLSVILLEFALFGSEERTLMVKLGFIQRIIGCILNITLSGNRIPESHLQRSVDLIALLIRNSTVQGVGSNLNLSPTKSIKESKANRTKANAVPIQMSGATHLSNLELEDVQAILSKVYLEESIRASHAETSLAIQHLCICLGSKECVKVADFLAEKVLEYTSNASGTSLNYRNYFKVLSDIVLGPGLDIIQNFSNIINKLTNKAYSLSSRQAANDAEFVYAVCKLLHRIGTANVAGHICVMRAREYWKEISVRFAQAKRPKNGTGATPDTSTAGTLSSNLANTSKSILERAAANATSFLLS